MIRVWQWNAAAQNHHCRIPNEGTMAPLLDHYPATIITWRHCIIDSSPLPSHHHSSRWMLQLLDPPATHRID